jgi:hypothetical protein
MTTMSYVRDLDATAFPISSGCFLFDFPSAAGYETIPATPDPRAMNPPLPADGRGIVSPNRTGQDPV